MVETIKIILTHNDRYALTGRTQNLVQRHKLDGWEVESIDYEKAYAVGSNDWRSVVTLSRLTLKKYTVKAGKRTLATELWYPEFDPNEVFHAETAKEVQEVLDERCLQAQTYLDPAYDEHGPEAVLC